MPGRPGNYEDLTGQEFGPLKVIERWGKQSCGVAWTCFCQSCGEVQKRNATHLRNGHRRRCRACHAEGLTRGKRRVKEPDSFELHSFRLTSPDFQRASQAVVDALTVRVDVLTDEQLTDIEDLVQREQARRIDWRPGGSGWKRRAESR